MWSYYNTKKRESQAENVLFGRQKRGAKREVELRKRRLERKLRGVNLPVEFNNKTVTAHGNFALIETFKRAIGMEKMIEKKFSLEKAPNSKFKANEILDRIIDCCIVGDSRFMHTEELRRDEGYSVVSLVSVLNNSLGMKKL